MQKLILLSIIVANVAIPVWASRDRSGRAGLKKMLGSLLVFNLVYLMAVMFIYPRLQ